MNSRAITGTVFNIQKFSVNDGPGIRTTVFLKGCPLHCGWCSNPESQSVQPQILYDNIKCIHCGQCATVCPRSAITLQAETIKIDHSKCIGCGTCVHTCPKEALQQKGKTQSVQEVVDIVLQDKVFYEDGGGMTLSGGEFLAQPTFAYALLNAAKEEGIHTCGETSGYCDPATFKQMLTTLDMLYFDVKHYDSQKHMEKTGVDNSIILSNLAQALEILPAHCLIPRIPVIPDFNDSIADAHGFVKLFQQMGIQECQLLPFHQFGENKYTQLGLSYAYTDVNAYHTTDLEAYLNVFLANDIHAYF